MPRLLPVLALLLAACEPIAEPVAAPPVAVAAGDSIVALTGTAAYQGELPCADCAGIRETLVLHPDGTYRLQDTYVGTADGDASFVEVGRWMLDVGAGRLALHGAGEGPKQFAVDGEQALTQLDEAGAPIVSEMNYTLRRLAAPPPITGTARLTGGFSYFAEAALFVECSSGKQFPVAGGSGYLALEQAYANTRPQPAAPVVTRVVGRLEMQPGMEGETLVESVMVDSAEVTPGAACAALALREQLGSGRWNITMLDGAAVPAGDDPAGSPHLEFRLERLGESRLAGTAGCNRISGRAILRGADLVGTPVASTMMMCPDSAVMAREQRLSQLLGEGGWFRMDGEALVLAQGGREVARLER
jgi:copper homeostasis protein (lipoprotein)